MSSQQDTSQSGKPGQEMDPAHGLAMGIHTQFPDAVYILKFSASL